MAATINFRRETTIVNRLGRSARTGADVLSFADEKPNRETYWIFTGKDSQKEKEVEDLESIESQNAFDDHIEIQSNITRLNKTISKGLTASGLETQEEEDVRPVVTWLIEKVKNVQYSEEYLKIKRNDNLYRILFYLDEILNSVNNKISKEMNISLLKNQINATYKTFYDCGQEIHFLSILHVVENIFSHDIDNKAVLRETVKLFKNLIDRSRVTFADYKVFVKRYFDLGVNFIALEDSQENPS